MPRHLLKAAQKSYLQARGKYRRQVNSLLQIPPRQALRRLQAQRQHRLVLLQPMLRYLLRAAQKSYLQARGKYRRPVNSLL
jgi:hypothetical protein